MLDQLASRSYGHTLNFFKMIRLCSLLFTCSNFNIFCCQVWPESRFSGSINMLNKAHKGTAFCCWTKSVRIWCILWRNYSGFNPDLKCWNGVLYGQKKRMWYWPKVDWKVDMNWTIWLCHPFWKVCFKSISITAHHVYFRIISRLVHCKWFLYKSLVPFWHTYFRSTFWHIYDQFLITFWPISEQCLTNFWLIFWPIFLPIFLPVF